MTKPKPSRMRQPRLPATLLRYLGNRVNIAQRWCGLPGDHRNEVNACLNRCRSLLAELRRSLAPRTRRGEG